MKRLSVQLSVVGAVVALGAAAIAYGILSGSGEEPVEKEQTANADHSASNETDSPSPIRVGRDRSGKDSPAADTLSSSTTEEKNAVQTVNHELSADASATGSETQSGTAPESGTGAADRMAGAANLLQSENGTEGRQSEGSEQSASEAVASSMPSESEPSSSSPSPPSPAYGASFASDQTLGDGAGGAENANASDAGMSGDTAGASAGTNPVGTEGLNRESTQSASPSSSGPGTSATQPSSNSAFPLRRSTESRGDGSSSFNSSEIDNPAGAAGPQNSFDSESSASTAPGGGQGKPSASASLGGISSTGPSGSRGSISGTDGEGSSSAQPPAGSGGPDSSSFADSGSDENTDDNISPGTQTGEAAGRQTFSSNSYSSNTYPSTGAGGLESSGGETDSVTGDRTGESATGPAREQATGNSSDAVNASGSSYGADLSMPSNASSATGTSAATALTVSDRPAASNLEGEQAPVVTVEKSAPEEIQVNREATFELRVGNNGNAVAENVTVVDRVPRGTEFVSATPSVTPSANGAVQWNIGVLKPGEEMVLSMRLLPKSAGEIGSVASASFQTRASVRTICTQPALKLELSAAERVLIGESVTLQVTVTNTGNGAAEDVVIDEDVPEGFTHPAGNKLEHEIGTLRPQESRRLSLVLESTKQGTFENHMTVRGAGDLSDQDTRTIEVISPELQVAMQGPTLRYLDRQANYTVQLTNPGTASAHNVELVTYLPKGMKYVTSDNHGQYDTQSHAVFWSLEELPANQPGNVHVSVLPIEPGKHKLKTDVTADLGLQEVCEHAVAVEGSAELSFIISDMADPIEVGSETTYEIKVRNRGSKAATQIRLSLELPSALKPTSGDGPTRGSVQGQQVNFAPLDRLGPGKEVVFKAHAEGSGVGDHIVRSQLQSAELTVPVTKEEITRVYSDN